MVVPIKKCPIILWGTFRAFIINYLRFLLEPEEEPLDDLVEPEEFEPRFELPEFIEFLDLLELP